MSSVATIFLTMPVSVGLGIFIWYIWNNNRKLDSRIAKGDLDLLKSPNYKISEVVRAPEGSRVEKVVIQQIQPNSQQYIKQLLPDGRVALIPVNESDLQVTEDYSTIRSSQQPPEQ